MLPELIVADVLLSMCGDRLTAVVAEDEGDPGPWMIGRDPPDGRTREDVLEELLRVVDPTVLLLLYCGWRTVAIELWADELGSERIELLASSLSQPATHTGSDEARWFVPLLRGEPSEAVVEGAKWELRFELTPQPLVRPELLIPLATLAGVTLRDLGSGAHQRVWVALGSSSGFSVDALDELLNHHGSPLLDSLAASLADAYARLGTPLHELGPGTVPSQTGLLAILAPQRWTLERADLATLTTALSKELAPAIHHHSSLLEPRDREWRREYFLLLARRLALSRRAEIVEVETALGEDVTLVYATLFEAWATAEPWLSAHGRSGAGGPWASWVVKHALELTVWLRLHNEGILDIVRSVAGDIRGAAHAAIDKAWSGKEPSQAEYSLVLALMRRYPNDPRVPEGRTIMVGGNAFGGLMISELPGAHQDAKAEAEQALAESPLCWGRWTVLGNADAKPKDAGPHDFVALPDEDVAPLAQALWEWTIGDAEPPHVPLAALSEARRADLAARLPDAQITLEQRVYIKTDYQHMPSPEAVRVAIGMPGVPLMPGDDPADLELSGKEVIVGHPDTGVTNPIHSAISAKIVTPVSARNYADMQTLGWPQHGTTTSSAIVGTGTFPGRDPVSGIEDMVTCRGIAPDARVIPWRIGNNVVLLTFDQLFRDMQAGGPRPSMTSSVGEVIAALYHFAGEDQDTRRADVVSISLGYKYDIFRLGKQAWDLGPIVVYPPALTPTALVDDVALHRMKNAATFAYERGVIVCAAAGQIDDPFPGKWMGQPTYPGAFQDVVGCAGLNGDGRPWGPSFRGWGVDVAVPCDGAWGCTFDEDGREIIAQSAGTSYATALTAGVAALWIEKYGAALDREGHNRATVFHHVLSRCGLQPVREDPNDFSSPRVPGFGHGRLDAKLVLAYDFWPDL